MSNMTRLVNVENRGRGGRQISTGFSLDQTSQVGEDRSRLCSVTKELHEYKSYNCNYQMNFVYLTSKSREVKILGTEKTFGTTKGDTECPICD